MEDEEELDWDDNFVYIDKRASADETGNMCNEVEELPDFDEEAKQALAKYGLTVASIPNSGRGLIADRDFKAGDCVLKQSPLAFSLSTSDASIKTRCSHCLGTAKLPKRCSRCKVVHYCSVEHQKKDWAIHSSECPRMARCMEANLPPTATMITLGRILDAKAREEQGSSKGHSASSPGSRFRDLMALSSLLQQHSQESLISFSQVTDPPLASTSTHHLPWPARPPAP
jgi:hypothetical protein